VAQDAGQFYFCIDFHILMGYFTGQNSIIKLVRFAHYSIIPWGLQKNSHKKHYISNKL